jgi:16S rRNA (adenine1518-N6/adenine1519-N6)-dimethyltransferase
MNRRELKKLLEGLDFYPGKQLGQNFLTDSNLLSFIVRSAAPLKGERILEVGPGFGALTRELLASDADVTAVEFDRRICEYLRKEFDVAGFRLIEGDACRVPLDEISATGGAFRCVANLPYSISSVFIARMLRPEFRPVDMLFMLQKEMGKRLASGPGTKNYGALSVRCQAVYDVKVVRMVPPEVFYPCPDVGSAIVRFVRKGSIPGDDVLKILDKLSMAVFGQRRKKMMKTFSRAFGEETAGKVWSHFSIKPDVRPDKMDVPLFVSVAEYLSNL